MKTFSAIVASLLLAAGSTVAYAGDRAGAAEGAGAGTATDREFTEMDREGQGFLDQDAAEEAGITQEEFEQMDQTGDGRVTEEEFRQYQQQQQREGENDDNGIWNDND